MSLKYLLISIIAFTLSLSARGQCCSMGNPMSGQTSNSVLPKNTLRVHTFYKYGYNQTYFRGNVRLVNYGTFSHSSYDFAGLHLAYGLTSKLTIEHDAGYFFDKQLRYNNPELDALTRSGYGLSNGLISLHYSLWNAKNSATELSVAAGLKYPFSTSPLVADGVELPVELQPGTGATGFVGRAVFTFPLGPKGHMIYVQHRFETNQPNPGNYTYGSAHHSTVSAGMPLPAGLQLMLQLRNEYRNSDTTPGAARLASEGSNLVFFSPVVSANIPAGLNIAVFADIPLYKHYFGEQLSSKYAAGISITRDFTF